MLGTGLVVARARDGWSPPSALGLCGFGWGLQAGGALCDVLIVLRSRCARRLLAGRGPVGWARRLM
jgi:lipid-binding SYLF domain-containing protein